jgi:hypothetical protein
VKSESEIRNRIDEAVFEEISRRVDALGERVPHKCIHNYRHPLDARKVTEEGFNPQYNRMTSEKRLPVLQTVGLCLLGSEDPSAWGGTICDEPIDAKRCPVFTPFKTKEDLVTEVKEQMADEVWLKEHMPEVYALSWAVGMVVGPRLSWWARFLLWIRRVTLEPQVAPFSSDKLLPPGS